MSNEITKRDEQTGQIASTHGAYSTAVLVPLVEEKTKEIIEMMQGTRAMVGRTDQIAVDLLARNLAKIQLFDEYLIEHGLFETTKDGEKILQPLLKVYWQALNSAARLCAALGLTTESRLRLGLQVAHNEDALSQIQRAKRKNVDENEVV